MNHTTAFWSLSTTEVLQQLQTTKEGLSGDEAKQRLARYGSNLLKPARGSDALTLLLAQFKKSHYRHPFLCNRTVICFT